MTSLQQSIMNFGILMVQGLVNSFGTVIMAAFAAAVKIDSFAYMPVQDFGNAFSTYVAQNYGANEKKRIKDGIKSAVIMSMVFCVFVSLLVSIFAKPLMQIFIDSGETQIIAVGVHYLRIEGVHGTNTSADSGIDIGACRRDHYIGKCGVVTTAVICMKHENGI